MIQYLSKLGINEFKNAKYIFVTKKVDLLGDGSPFDTKTEIETWELEGGYKYLNISIGVDDVWSTAFSARYIDTRLFDTTKAEREFGFKAKMDFAEGLRKTIDWYIEKRKAGVYG